MNREDVKKYLKNNFAEYYSILLLGIFIGILGVAIMLKGKDIIKLESMGILILIVGLFFIFGSLFKPGKPEKAKNQVIEVSKNDLTAYIDLFKHWDDSYWTATYVFLIIQGALIAALTAVFATFNDHSWLVIWAAIVFFFSLFGISVSVIMFFVLNRKITYTHGAEAFLEKVLKEMYDEIKSRQTGIHKYSSARIMQTCLPILFGTFWLIAALLSVYYLSKCLY